MISANAEHLRATLGASVSAPCTIAALFNTADTSANKALVSLNTGGGNRRVLYLDTTTVVAGASAAGAIASATAGYSASVANSAAGVFTSTTSRAAYIAGGNKGTNSTSSSEGALSILAIGATYIASWGTYLQGEIAEAAVWSVELTDDEIVSLARGFKPSRIRPQSLVFYAPMIRSRGDRKGGVAVHIYGGLGLVNRILESQDFNDSPWSKTRLSSITGNATTAPDGTNTGAKLIPVSGSGVSAVFTNNSTSYSASTDYICSVYFKAAEKNIGYVQINTYGGTTKAGAVAFDLSAVSVGSVAALAGGGISNMAGSIASVGNGWYRCAVSFTSHSTAGTWDLYFGPTDSTNNRTVSGNASDGIYIWGAQIETGSTASAYQRTNAATAYDPAGSAVVSHPRTY